MMRLFVLCALYLVSLSLCTVIIHAAFRGADNEGNVHIVNATSADRIYDGVASGQGAMFIMVFTCIMGSVATTAAYLFWKNIGLRVPAIGFTIGAIEIALVGTTVMFVLDETQPAWINLPIGSGSVLASAVFLLLFLTIALIILCRGPKKRKHEQLVDPDELAGMRVSGYVGDDENDEVDISLTSTI